MTDATLENATIVFDLDGTLVDTAPDLTNALNEALTAAGFEAVSPASARASVAFGARAMILEGLRQNGSSEAALPPQRIEAMLADFLSHYEAHIADRSRPFEGALGVLDRLQADGARLAVCTNKRVALALQLLEKLDIAGRFAAIAGRDSFAASKPDPLHLTETIRIAGGSPGRALMVGDSTVDIETARAAGLPSVAVSFGYGGEALKALPADITIDHYNELEAAVRRLIPGAAAGESAAPGRASTP